MRNRLGSARLMVSLVLTVAGGVLLMAQAPASGPAPQAQVGPAPQGDRRTKFYSGPEGSRYAACLSGAPARPGGEAGGDG